MKIVTAAEMREIDRITTEQYGVPSLTLMENAGASVAENVMLSRKPRNAVVVCGKGNNGGDGFVTARHLKASGVEVQVVTLCEPAEYSGDAKQMLDRLGLEPVVLGDQKGIREFFGQFCDDLHIIVDALLGTGFKPPLSPLYEAAIQAINSVSQCEVHAVDIPSGLEADKMSFQHGTFVHAALTTTFTAMKPAHVFHCHPGMVSVKGIGTPAEAIRSKLRLNLVEFSDVDFLKQPRDPESNKGTYGHVLVLGGSMGKAGAAAMAGMAALRSGAGLVSIATPKSVLNTVAGFAPELMTIPLGETSSGGFSVLNFERMREISDGKRVIAVGCGAGQDEETKQFLRAFVDRCEMPVVLDADGLNAFAGHINQLTPIRHPLILTPHPGELARLVGQSVAEVQSNRINTARWFAEEHGCYVVLKGHQTLIAEPNGEVWINTTGNAGMATGGTGDVLTGIIAGLVSQFPDRIRDAVIGAVYLHGVAGDIAADLFSERAMIATDLVHVLPRAYRALAERAV
jgi:ADP-dependent NAD(P)H-hydrate dehydratase / NAD(P)H-hydrate epimerase